MSKKLATRGRDVKTLTPPIEFIDAGAQLNHPAFQKDLKAVIEFSQSQNVNQMMVLCRKLTDIHSVLNSCLTHSGTLFTTVGVHPHYAQGLNLNKCISEMKILLRSKSALIKAIGLIGLDYTNMKTSQKEQMDAFEAQVKLGCELKVPLVVFERQAHYDVVKILEKYKTRLPRTLIHVFSGNQEQLQDFLGLGCHIGICGSITTTQGEDLRSFIHEIPLTHMLLQSNAPFMIPYGVSDLLMDPRRNEPATLRSIAKVVLECWNENKKEETETFVALTLGQFAEEMRKNTKAFYSLL